MKITIHNAEAVIQRLLTEPRNNREYYAFWGGNPRVTPPEDLDYVSDLNSGKAFTDTHAKLCKEPGDRFPQYQSMLMEKPLVSSTEWRFFQCKSPLVSGTMRHKTTLEYSWISLVYVERIPVNKG